MQFPLLAFLLFGFVASITPGPNNVMIAAVGASHGLRAALPMISGIVIGFGVLVVLVGLGLSVPLAAYPWLHTLLRGIGAAWLLLLAWKIATAPAPGQGERRAPMGLVGGAMFQWINPKAWVLALSVATTWTVAGAPLVPQILTMSALLVIVGIPSSLAWALLGASASRALAVPARLRTFNLVMAGLLVLSMVPVLLQLE
ncbi:MAG: LysE family translocator [Rhodospirillales bacterium]|nr:LysE family translocator [Rhodospirillales bacterium]MDE2198152.1 LysE family translocator [Rhodospirillales bacterium]MDE2575943.1 LysE family translocator [Rhodospirillales bacterium]